MKQMGELESMTEEGTSGSIKAEAYDGFNIGNWSVLLNLNFRFPLTGFHPTPPAEGEGI